MPLFSVTYESWTDADLEAGDTDTQGYAGKNLRLRDAIAELRAKNGDLDSVEADDSRPQHARWITVSYRPNYYDGSDTHDSFSLHIPDNVRPSSRARVVRLVKTRY